MKPAPGWFLPVVFVMDATPLFERLTASNPGWEEWDKLVALAESLELAYVTTEHMGNFYTDGCRLSFAELTDEQTWPAWLPPYVAALYGMKADNCEMAGGYADSFCNEPARKGSIFSPAGNDEELGYPLIDVADDVYDFQSDSSGATFFVNKKHKVLYPNSHDKCFEILDTLEEFTRKNIQQALDGKPWFAVYQGLKGSVMD